MLRKNLLSFFLIALAFSCFSQNSDRCGTAEVNERLMNANPEAALSRQNYLEKTRDWISEHSGAIAWDTSVDYIPIVVHVVYKAAAENISIAQIQSQIDAMNADFRRTNWDASQTPSYFSGVGADCKFEFILANKDPAGNPTNGITFNLTTYDSFSTNQSIFFDSLGGADIWDRDCYLNIWVCNISGTTFPGMLGYAFYPGTGTVNTDGIVIDYRAFGTMGTALPPFNKGRTVAHEIGHYFDLKHVFGGGPGCADDDEVSDTPLQDLSTPATSCPTGIVTDACTAGNGIMYQNFLDYTQDACMNIFTEGQKTRMKIAMNNVPRSTLTTCMNIGIRQKTVESSIRIFPNPSDGKFSVSGLENSKTKIEVINLLGEKINFHSPKSLNYPNTPITIDLTSRPPGLYFVIIHSGTEVTTKKIMLRP